MADATPSFQSTIKKVDTPPMSLLDRIADYLGYEKKSGMPTDVNLFPNDLRPKPRENKPISQPYKDMKKTDKSSQDYNVKVGVSTSKNKSKPQDNIPLATLPGANEINTQDPRNTKFRDPVKDSPEQGVIDFLNIEPLKKLVEGSLQKGPSLLANIGDKLPERDNEKIADDFTEKYRDQIMNMNRVDLGPAMALADFWTGGKSKLAASYKAPKSVDEMYDNMMQLRQSSIKQRDDAELKQKDQQLDAYDKIFIRPRTNLIESLSRLNQGTGRDITSMLRTINAGLQSGENAYANNVSNLQSDVLRTRTAREMKVRDIKSSAEELNARINAELGRRGSRDKNDYYKNIDRVLATIVAPKFTKSGTPLPEDRKEWSKNNSKTLGSIINFADFVISSRGFDVKRNDIGELMRLRENVLNEIAMGFNNGVFTDPELQQLSDEFNGNKGN